MTTTQVKFRRGTTTEHSTFTGSEGEITVDTTKHTAVVHDGATAGGFPLVKEGHQHSLSDIIGTSNKSANGYTLLPNGIKMVWGWVSANSSDGNAAFSSQFTTIYNVTATSNSAVATYQAAVINSNTTVALIRTANDASTNVFWHAIGI